jgi:hypothetical protein
VRIRAASLYVKEISSKQGMMQNPLDHHQAIAAHLPARKSP